ncbi:uncharacterized protein LDX57_007778 [Aspergillus melleus]|uniref:uncharacterized protein n=1 Tax=Aspergillus melleus TaxID=138277 RepID=UPI001E8EA1E0|nr:uncharacterized protein LDX57_007778 [Aspergillus melleus]KAH8430108.1 hypothetical protein LDX57_007778 [Aspergillus melleus]
MHHSMNDNYQSKRKRRSESPPPRRDNDFRAPPPRVQPLPKSADSPTKDAKTASTAELFKPLAEELERLDKTDPVLAAQAARLVALYRRIWDSYILKHADSQRLENENRRLETKNASLEKEKRDMEGRYEEQRTLLTHFQKSFESVQDGITRICDSWKDAPAVLLEGRGEGRPVGNDGHAPADSPSVTPAANQKAPAPASVPVPPKA